MITKDPYGIKGARVCRSETTAAPEALYTNDPLPMVNHCLTCARARCRGECDYTVMGEGRRVYKRRKA